MSMFFLVKRVSSSIDKLIGNYVKTGGVPSRVLFYLVLI